MGINYSITRILPIILIICFGFLFCRHIAGCSRTYNGEKLFHREGCSQCHTFRGKGGRMGPDLSGVTNVRTEKWIDSYLQNPKKMYPFSRMPSFDHLSSGKRRAIILFLKK